jgi:hypothetical protein
MMSERRRALASQRQAEPEPDRRAFVAEQWIDYDEAVPDWVKSDMEQARRGLMGDGVTPEQVEREWHEIRAFRRWQAAAKDQ